ncbi:MAG: diguanylate cyclase [Planctomycetota bacterium]
MKLIEKLPITTKLLIILLLVSVIPLYLSTYGFYRLSRNKLTEQTIHALDIQAKNTLSQSEHYINSKFTFIHQIVNSQQLKRILRATESVKQHTASTIIPALRAKLRAYPANLSLFILDATGTAIVSTSDGIQGNYAARPFFSEAMKGKDFVSSPCVDHEQSCIYFSIPLMVNDKIEGVVTLQCKADELWEIIDRERDRVGAGNAVIVSNFDGVRIAHSNRRDLIFKSWIPLQQATREQILKEDRYGEGVKEIDATEIPVVMDAVISISPPSYFTHGLVIGTETYHSVIKVMDNGWRIISTVPESTFLEPVHSFTPYIFIISGMVTCLIVGISFAVGRLATRRIKFLAVVSEDIIGGNFSRVVPFANGDEIGQLGKAFNAMTASIRDRIEQLKTLYQKGLMVTRAKNLKGVLDEVLFSAMELVETPAGCIILTKNASVAFTSQKGLRKDIPKEFHEIEVPHFLLKQGELIEFQDVEADPIFKNSSLREEGIKSLLILPIPINADTSVVIYLGDFKKRGITERHKYLTKNFCTLAAQAVEKQIILHDLEESLAYLQCTLNDSQDMIITTDREGRAVNCSTGIERILGYTADDIIGKNVGKLYVNPNERIRLVESLLKEKALCNYETTLRKKNGDPVDVSLTISLLKDKAGHILGTVGISKDITLEKRMREELKRKNKELEEFMERLEEKVFERTKELERTNKELANANELKGRFIANVSHELKTPLHSIIGFAEILLQKTFGDLTDKQQKYLTTIFTSGKHLFHLVNNILDLAKIEAGKVELSCETFTVDDIVEEVMSVIRPLSDRKRIEQKVTVHGKISAFTADRLKIKQILYNLLSNAIKFTPECGKVGIDIEEILSTKKEFAWAMENQKFLRISVWDNGPGIKQEDRERIFEEFEQLDPSKSTEGTGLGLSLTKKLVEIHGGQIEVQGEHKQGAIFNVYLPYIHHEQIVTKPEHIFTPDIPLSDGKEGALILVVEDDIPTVEILTIHLTQGGYKVAHAYDGEEAIIKAKELKPFLITLDIMLPKKDGWEVLQSLKNDPETRDIPVIIHSIIENKELAFALGATDYMVKPLDKNILLGKLMELSLATKKTRYPVNILIVTSENTIKEGLCTMLGNEGFQVQHASDIENGLNLALMTKPGAIIIDLDIPEGGFEATRKFRENINLKEVPIFAITSGILSIDERLKMISQVERVLCKDSINSRELIGHLRSIELLHPRRAGLIDELTGVFNCRYFQIRLAQETTRATRYNLPLALIILDIDQFNHYVGMKGEYYGNLVLKKVADILRKNLRGSDALVRYGRDSFAIILTNTLFSPSILLARRFVTMVADYPFLHEEVQPNGKITASIGLSAFKEQTPEDFIYTAELALSTAIQKGRNRVEVYEKP